MSGRSSRNKGKNGELEVRDLLREHGYEATRNRIGAANDDLIHNVPGVSIEVKRAETLQIPRWLRQCEEQAKDLQPVLFFRQSRQPWRVIIGADFFLSLLAHSQHIEDLMRTYDYHCETCGVCYPLFLGSEFVNPPLRLNGDLLRFAKPHADGCMGSMWELCPEQQSDSSLQR